MNNLQKLYRFSWRFLVNFVCVTTVGRNWLFPPGELSSQFGRGDANYAWSVYQSHFHILRRNGFDAALRILEIGPGRNLGTSLLWWCFLSGRTDKPVEIHCWDVFKNATPETAGFWSLLARELLVTMPKDGDPQTEEANSSVLNKLRSVAEMGEKPHIFYQVMSLDELAKQADEYELVYSQAAIEHIWNIGQFWESIAHLTKAGGWHSHRIDLADHGRRETNYIEMLQWSNLTYWLTQRFVPGAINRWRAGDHMRKLESLGFKMLHQHRELADSLPIPRQQLARIFRELNQVELRTTALTLLASKLPE